MGEIIFQGVEIRGNSIRLTTQINGKRHRKTLNLEPTEANLRHAQKVRRVWIAELKAGQASTPTSFGAIAKQWLDGQDHLAKSTRKGYRNLINRYWMPPLWDREIQSITGAELKALVASYDWKTQKTRNNAISTLRMIFESAFLDEVIDRDPAARIVMGTPEEPEPDPLDQDEVAKMLEGFAKAGTGYLNYFQFGFYSGLRTSELIDLPWKNVDFRREIVRVDSAWVHGERKVTKTKKRRDIELHPRAREALKRQKALTFLGHRNVFVDPITGQPYVSDKPPRLIWDRVIKAAGIRRRTPYEVRHTYATFLLMAGCNPMWVARQLGHSTMQTTLRIYGSWIEGADKGSEMAKVTGSDGEPMGSFRGTEGNEGA